MLNDCQDNRTYYELMNNKKILFIAHMFEDGSGDFTFCSKVIDLLLLLGIDKQNIQVIFQFTSNKYIEPLHTNLTNEYNNCTKTNIDDIYNDIGLSKYISDEINKLIMNFCKKYKYIKQMQNCENEIDKDLSIGELQEIRQKIQQYMIDSKKIISDKIKSYNDMLDQSQDPNKYKQYCENISSIYYKTNDCENIIRTIDDPNNIKQEMIKHLADKTKNLKLSDDKSCIVNGEKLSKYVNDYINNIFLLPSWTVWINNVIKFFFTVNRIPMKNFHFISYLDFPRIIPSAYGLTGDNNNNLVITYYIQEGQILYQNLPASIKELNMINLNEGGLWNSIPKCITSGFNANYTINKTPHTNGSRVIGINIYKDSNHEDLATVIGDINTTQPFHLCYFGQITQKLDVSGILFLYKLKIFLSLVKKYYNINNVIYLNRIPYDFLKTFIVKFPTCISYIFSSCVIDENYITINDEFTIKFYSPLSTNDFMRVLKKSEDLCVLTGDQSYYEGISLGKNILYDLPIHKYGLYDNIVNMYKYYSDAHPENPTPQNISGLYTIFTKLVKINKDYFLTIPSPSANISELSENINIISVPYKQQDGRVLYTTYKFENDTIVIVHGEKTEPYLYNDLAELYEKVYNLCASVLANKEKFRKWLDTYINYEKNLGFEILKTLGTLDLLYGAFYDTLTPGDIFKLSAKHKLEDLPEPSAQSAKSARSAQSGGTLMYSKYMKYKTKYHELANLINQN